MIEPGSYHISFGSLFDQDSLKLIEFPPFIVEDIVSGVGQVCIRGDNTDNVVIVTNDRTFNVNLVESSNSMFLIEPTPDDANIWTIVSAPSHHYELIESVPDLSRVGKLLQNHCIAIGDVQKLSHLDEHPLAGVPTEELYGCIQASDSQITSELRRNRSICIDGRWFGLKTEVINSVLSEILDVAQACAYPLNNLSLTDIASELADVYPVSLLGHILRCFSKDPGVDGPFQLDERAVCRQIAIRILLENPRIPYDKFIRQWQLEIPPLMDPDEKYLLGIAFSDDSTLDKKLSYVPLESLPRDPKERFDVLFKIRTKWNYDELVAYLSDLLENGHPLEAMILKYTRSIQRGQYYVSKTSRNLITK